MAGLPDKVRDPRAQFGEDFEVYMNLEPGVTKGSRLEADRTLVAVFDITPTDGPVLAAAMNVRSSQSLSDEEEAVFARSARVVQRGATTIVHCEAKAGDMALCLVRNKGDKPVTVRVRRRWWGLEEQAAPPPPEVLSKHHTLPPGGSVEMLLTTVRTSKVTMEVLPENGTVWVSRTRVKDSGNLSEQERTEAESRLRSVPPAPAMLRDSFDHLIGEVYYVLIVNRSDKSASIQVRSTFARAR